MWAFRFTWEVLTGLGHPQADEVMALAVQIIQTQLDKISDPAHREMYLSQPHHRVLWEAWQAAQSQEAAKD